MPKKPTYYPVVKSFPITGGSNPITIYDASRNLSRMNRRLYRMGRNYQLSVNIRPDTVITNVEVFALRNDWSTKRAFKMAYDAYLRSTADERKTMSKGQIARWEDFRVLHGIPSATSQEGVPVAYNKALTGIPMTVGEHVQSEARDDSNTSYTFTWADITASGEFGILQEYDKYADTQNSPSNTVSGAESPYDNLGADISDDAVDDLENNGNSPPYNPDCNTFGPWNRVAVLGNDATGKQKLSTGFFDAPCGFVLIKGYTYSGDPQIFDISVVHKHGDYKGVHAPSMLE